MNSDDYTRIEKVIVFLEENYQRQPSLQEIADQIGLSPYHSQRLFKRWAGISPKRFIQYLTSGHAKAVLENSGSILDAAFEAGLSGPGRLHDLFVTFDAVTPGEFRQKGDGLLIQYGYHPSPFGNCFLGLTERGICWLSFFGDEGPDRSRSELFRQWAGARFKENPEITAGYIKKIFSRSDIYDKKPLILHLKGTNFQIKVWEALLKLPPAGLFSYESLAASIKMPKAIQAVAAAISRNPVSYIIPCHRVLRKSGQISGYRWGTARKKAIIAWEAAHAERIFHP